MSVSEKVAAQHTPGPWDVIPVFILQSDHEALHFSEYRIREFGGGADYAIRPRETAEANARLIAAAPEMLEALEATTRLLDTLYWEICADTQELGQQKISRWPELVRAEAAIQKAKGGAL